MTPNWISSNPLLGKFATNAAPLFLVDVYRFFLRLGFDNATAREWNYARGV